MLFCGIKVDDSWAQEAMSSTTIQYGEIEMI